MRVALLSNSEVFRLAVCEGILDAGSGLVAVMEGAPRARRRLLGVRRHLGQICRAAWPELFAPLSADPLHAFLHRRHIPFLRAPSAKTREFATLLRSLDVDLVVMSRFPEILPPDVIRIPRVGFVNIHCSLLPSLRGPTPIQGAIIQGYRESGVTIHFANDGMDRGDIILQRRIPLEPAETYRSFTEKALRLMRPMMGEVVRTFLHGDVPRVPPERGGGSYFSVRRLFGVKDVCVDWAQPAQLIEAVIRSGVLCFTTCARRVYRIWEAHIRREAAAPDAPPGLVFAAEGARLLVATRDLPIEVAVAPHRARRWWSVRDDEDVRGRGSNAGSHTLRGRLPLAGDRLESRGWPPVPSRFADRDSGPE